MKIVSSIFYFILWGSYNLFAQAGLLDSSFNGNGKVTTISENEYSTYGTSIAIQSDNKIVAGAIDGSFLLIRYNYDGSIDSDFGEIFTTIPGGYELGTGVLLQPDGKILQSGLCYYGFALVRFNGDGSIDYGFGDNGIAITSFDDYHTGGSLLKLQPDGKIVQGGYTDLLGNANFALIRYNSDGILDNTFGTDGRVETDFDNYIDLLTSIRLQQDGKIVAAGFSGDPEYRFELARYNSDGSLDPAFGTGGKVVTKIGLLSELQDMIVQADGKILIAGTVTDTGFYSTHVFKLLRYNSDGTIDNSFGTNGIVSSPNYGGLLGNFNLTFQPDGKIILAGGGNCNQSHTVCKFGVERYFADGLLDSTFGDSGLVIADLSDIQGTNVLRDVAIDQNGRIIVIGYAEYSLTHYCVALARFLSGLNVGILDLSISNLPILIYPNPIQKQAVLEYTLNDAETISITLLDVQQRIVQTFMQNQQRMKGEQKEVLVFDKALTAGAYILSISNGVHQQNIKIIKEK